METGEKDCGGKLSKLEANPGCWSMGRCGAAAWSATSWRPPGCQVIGVAEQGFAMDVAWLVMHVKGKICSFGNERKVNLATFASFACDPPI